MKIKSIKAEGLFSAHYRFELAFDGQSAIEGKLFETNEKLSTVIDFLFLGKTEGIATDGKAQCEFSSNGTEYTLSREKAYENSICLLTRVQNGNVERFPDADAKLFEHLKHWQPRRTGRLAVVGKALAKPRLVGDVRVAIVRSVRVLFAHRGDRRDSVLFTLHPDYPRYETRLANDRLPDKFALRAEVGRHPLTMRVCDFLPLCSTTPDSIRASSTQ